MIYIREEAHGGFSMPAKGGGAVTVMLVEVVGGEPGEGGGVEGGSYPGA